MSKSILLRGGLVLLCLLVSLASLAPTVMKESLPDWWLKAFDPIQLGLDLQGGIHLVLGVEVEKAVEARLDSITDQSETLLREKDIIFKRVERLPGESLAITVYDQAAGDQVDALMQENFPTLEALTVTQEGGFIQKNYRVSDQELTDIGDYAVRPGPRNPAQPRRPVRGE